MDHVEVVREHVVEDACPQREGGGVESSSQREGGEGDVVEDASARAQVLFGRARVVARRALDHPHAVAACTIPSLSNAMPLIY